MKFMDMNDDSVVTLPDLKKDWLSFKEEEPENHAETFSLELYEILMATVNGRNNLEIIGFTGKEISSFIETLRKKLWKEICMKEF